MSSSYDQNMPRPNAMAVNTQFMFTEAHIRLLIWMCDSHQEYLERACDDILKQGDHPSDNLMNCREGIAELKIWAHRLLEAIEEEDDDEDEMGDDEDDEAIYADNDIEAVREALQVKWNVHRSAPRRERRTALQKLRDWLRSLL